MTEAVKCSDPALRPCLHRWIWDTWIENQSTILQSETQNDRITKLTELFSYSGLSFLVGSYCYYQAVWAASWGVKTFILRAKFPAVNHLDSCPQTGGYFESENEEVTAR